MTECPYWNPILFVCFAVVTPTFGYGYGLPSAGDKAAVCSLYVQFHSLPLAVA